MVEDHPVRGIGAGNFANTSVHYLLQPGAIARDDFIVDTPKVAHNSYLEVLAELGVIGLVLFALVLAFALTCIVKATWLFERLGDRQMELLSRGLHGGARRTARVRHVRLAPVREAAMAVARARPGIPDARPRSGGDQLLVDVHHPAGPGLQASFPLEPGATRACVALDHVRPALQELARGRRERAGIERRDDHVR